MFIIGVDMPLPVSPRVLFKRNPLSAVSAQIRYPPILRVKVEAPAEFQESVRPSFPGYSVVDPSSFPILPDVPVEVQNAIRAALLGAQNLGVEKAHRFASDNDEWVIQLTAESLTIGCKKYSRWEDFRRRLEVVWSDFVRIYAPPYATMVGIRYQNAIERSKLGLSGVGWGELLKPFIAAEFGCDGIREDEIQSSLHRFELSLPDSDRVLVQHALATNQATKEKVYSIDNNFNTTSRVELPDVFKRLDKLNGHSGSLFRLCITDRLYTALEPTEI